MFILLALLKKLTADSDRETELLHRIGRKDEAALSELYDLYKSLLYSLCVSIVKDRAEAEELLQEIFVQVWEKASGFDRSKGTPYAWLTTMTRNKAIDILRSRSYKENQITDNDTDDIILPFLPSDEPSPYSAAVAKERSSMIQTILKAIPDEQRSVLVAAYFEGYSQTEIADQTGLPLGTVKSRMRQGLIKLQHMLAGKEEQL
ncbi:MAG: sigma-70 family RNA polymerase sigma factor [Balneolia bacterium]|nr:sigma-70 family RNA polymerase sigma factor [Balneolia bacterium]